MIEENQSCVPADCSEHYRRLYSLCGQVLNESLDGDRSTTQSASHNYAADFEKWIAVLSARPEAEALRAALREYQFGMLALVLGQYRQAFMALRLFLELALASVYFSAHEVELRTWLRGERDVAWQCLVDTNSGVFSKWFVRAFYDQLAEEAPRYRTVAEKVYRECSEYTHGNPKTGQPLPTGVAFSQDVFADWHEKASSVRLAVSFALCARYLRVLKPDACAALEAVVTDELGHIEAVREVFGGATEADNA